MRYKRQLVSSIVISIVVGLGFFVLIANQAKAQDQCTLSITKVALPADDTEFTFIGTGDDDFSFPLSDPSNPTTGGGIDIGDTLIITEELPPGWRLDNIECTEGTSNCGQGVFEPCLRITIDEETNSISAFCDDIDTGSCTFTNVSTARNVPTLSEWGLIAMAGILGVVGFMVMRRRKVTA